MFIFHSVRHLLPWTRGNSMKNRFRARASRSLEPSVDGHKPFLSSITRLGRRTVWSELFRDFVQVFPRRPVPTQPVILPHWMTLFDPLRAPLAARVMPQHLISISWCVRGLTPFTKTKRQGRRVCVRACRGGFAIARDSASLREDKYCCLEIRESRQKQLQLELMSHVR